LPSLAVAFKINERHKTIVTDALAGAGEAVYLTELDPPARAAALRAAAVLLARNTAQDLLPGEADLLEHARLIQFLIAGVDFVPLGALPPRVPVATNGGGFAEAMAEHALAMALAAAKHLVLEHDNLRRGAFNQFTPTRSLTGRTCGIFCFGGIGIATARLMRAVGMRVHAINRRGRSEEPVDWMGTPDRLDDLLAAADLLVISTSLTRSTHGRIGRAELERMKEDAILVNLARGEIIQEKALYDHLVAHPKFIACIDAWWVEPVRHGAFRMDQPFLTLPNVIGSPHNSAQARGAFDLSLRRAVENCRRALVGETPRHLVGEDERLT